MQTVSIYAAGRELLVNERKSYRVSSSLYSFFAYNIRICLYMYTYISMPAFTGRRPCISARQWLISSPERRVHFSKVAATPGLPLYIYIYEVRARNICAGACHARERSLNFEFVRGIILLRCIVEIVCARRPEVYLLYTDAQPIFSTRRFWLRDTSEHSRNDGAFHLDLLCTRL